MDNLKHKLLAASRKIEAVNIPELGETIYLRRINGYERDIYQKAGFEANEKQKIEGISPLLILQPLLLSMAICDDKGEQIFENTDEVSRLDAVVLDRLGEKALALNGLTKESKEAIEKKALEVMSGSGITSPTS